MRNISFPTTLRVLALGCLVALVAPVALAATSSGQGVAEKDKVEAIKREVLRLPYYGVFDFLSFTIDRGTVTLMGYAYAPALRADAEQAVKRVPGIDDVVNKVEALPAGFDDDRIRRATFYNIYTDSFLSRYASGGEMGAYYALRDSGRFPGMQPFGAYPIHIIVKNGRTTLMGVVANQADKQMAEMRAREVPGVFNVENDLVIENQTDRR